MALVSKTKASRDERERRIKLKHRFENRVTIAKYGKEALDKGDYAQSLKMFVEYLSIMAEIKSSRDIYGLKVAHFDPNRDLTEMLMISHIYFEMARLYDAVPKFHEDARRCLEQFVAFTANQPFQVVNSEMVRKYLKKSNFKNPGDFRYAYEQIYIQSRKCYVVTFCYGDSHPITSQYREFKTVLLSYRWGQPVVRWYYVLSSTIIDKWEHNRLAKLVGQFIFRPLLLLFSKTFLRVILKKC